MSANGAGGASCHDDDFFVVSLDPPPTRSDSEVDAAMDTRLAPEVPEDACALSNVEPLASESPTPRQEVACAR